ncbi:hypothetical protein ACH5RR_018263 [Cinchona calisaya]|uniref:Uncharacterized protein n=1 Tax=Cinchona calisaya TaxID=153742 RepID=A0ABD2ZLV8_9GENT
MAALQSSAKRHPLPSISSFASVVCSSNDDIPLVPPSTYRGKPAVFFPLDTVQKLSKPFRFALVRKFLRGRPAMESMRHDFLKIGYMESKIAPILINFEGLRPYLFHKVASFSIAQVIGNCFKADISIATGSRLDKDKVHVDLDVSKPRLGRVWIANDG